MSKHIEEMMKRKNYTPKELYDLLRKSVIGQEDYLKKISVTVWLHNERIKLYNKRYEYGFLHLQKSNLLCIGPTGAGKTLAVTTLAKLYGLKVIVADVSAYTGAGWKGSDAVQLIKNLYLESNRDKRETECGIIVMDEIDKALLQGQDKRYPTASVEHTLLKMIEGTDVEFEDNNRSVHINTSNILFIASGAFEGIEEIIKSRVQKGTFGFSQKQNAEILLEKNYMQYLERSDLLQYGVGAQFLGRFAELAILQKLTADNLTGILLKSESSIVRALDDTLKYSCGVRVTVDEAGAKVVAEAALQEGTGARGLAQIIQPAVNEAIFQLNIAPEESSTVNEFLLTEQGGKLRIIQKEGERFQPKAEKGTWKKEKQKYNLPKAKRRHVEHFCWHVLSYYLNANPQPYSSMKAMHNLLCSMIFYLYEECNESDWRFSNIWKLLDEEIYRVLIEKIKFPGRAEVYYRAYREGLQYGADLKIKEALQMFDNRAYIQIKTS